MVNEKLYVVADLEWQISHLQGQLKDANPKLTMDGGTGAATSYEYGRTPDTSTEDLDGRDANGTVGSDEEIVRIHQLISEFSLSRSRVCV